MPGARYAKSFNTLTAAFQVEIAHREPRVVQWVTGVDEATRATVSGLVRDAGYRGAGHYDHDKYRRELWARGVKPRIARRQTPHGSGLGRMRWVVERTFAWLHFFRRLCLRWERRADIHQAVLALGCAVICQRYLRTL